MSEEQNPNEIKLVETFEETMEYIDSLDLEKSDEDTVVEEYEL